MEKVSLHETVLSNLMNAILEQYEILGADGEETADMLCQALDVLARTWKLDEALFSECWDSIEQTHDDAIRLQQAGMSGLFYVPDNAAEVLNSLVKTAAQCNQRDAARLLGAVYFLRDYWES